jgi:ribosomal protein S18 acetylase RimI-like enzyme
MLPQPRKKLDGITFRLANTDDVPALVALYTRFFAEAVYKDLIEFDAETAENHLRLAIGGGFKPHILAVADSGIVGFICYTLDDSFSLKPVAVMSEFYVIPERRKSALGRALLALAVHLATGDGACAFHAPIASGLSETRTMRNMLAKGGFAEFGYIMRRGL